MRALTILVAIAVLGAGCDRSEPSRRGADAAPTTEAASADATAANATAADGSSDADAAPTCEQRRARAQARVDEILSQHRSCRWDHECVRIAAETRCGGRCPSTVAASEVVATREAIAEVDAECAAFVEAGCAPAVVSCGGQTSHCRRGKCVARLPGEPALPSEEMEVPEQNARARADDPPPRPPVGEAEAQARRLFEAIVHDDPARIADFYFPREAFLEVKGIADPGDYWDRLFARYFRDIHSLHEALGDLEGAEFVRFELSRRGGWVGLREEGNRLPYWVSRHSAIHYRVGDQERQLEVRVVITWGDQWYITHLCEFHCDEPECCQPEA